MTFGSESATPIAPTDATGCLSKIGVQFPPPSVDFHTPPAAPPKRYVFGSPGIPVTASERPPRYGPINRHLRPLKRVSGTVWADAAAAINRVARNVRSKLWLLFRGRFARKHIACLECGIRLT